jgi:3-deoxy-D-manno-octulosonic-acid transferase
LFFKAARFRCIPAILAKNKILSKLLYHLFVWAYAAGIRLAALWNTKARLWVKGRQYFPKRSQSQKPCIWMHCASLGEFEQGRPLLELLQQQHPQVPVVVSFFSPSGFEQMKNYSGAADVIYLPMDGWLNARRLIKAINPQLVLWVKYEFWYYYLSSLKQQGIPVLLVAGLFRPGQPFFRWYGYLWRQMLHSFHHLFVQNQESIDLLQQIGLRQQVSLGGDTRFDRVLEIASAPIDFPLIAAFVQQCDTVVAGSTWQEDEEELVHYVKANPQIKFIIAPHEIDADNIAEVEKRFKKAIRYTALQAAAQQQDVWEELLQSNCLIIDNMGMLSRLYYYATVAYVGGGFNAGGIHNVLEPAVFGIPVVFGPVFEKFAEASELVKRGGAISIDNALELEALLNQLLSDTTYRQHKGDIARQYVKERAGAASLVGQYIQANRLLTN